MEGGDACGFVGNGLAVVGDDRSGACRLCTGRRLRASKFMPGWRTEQKGIKTRRGEGSMRETPTAVFLWHRSPDDEDQEEDDDGIDDIDGDLGAGSPDSEKWDANERFSRSRFDDNSFSRGKPALDGSQSADAQSKSAAIYAELKNETPETLENLRTQTSGEAYTVFQRTAQAMVGTLPARTFEIRVATDRNGIESLLYSSMVTGYVVRNAEYRMKMNEKVKEGIAEVFNSFDPTSNADDEVSDGMNAPEYMLGVPDKKKLVREELRGVVSWTNKGKEKVEVDVNDYVDRLEAKLQALKNEVEPRMQDDVANKLLHFLMKLPQQTITSMGTCISEPAVDAMRRILKDRLGSLNQTKLTVNFTMSREYLAQYVCWCLMIGYCIRNLEKNGEVSELLTSYRRGMHMRNPTPPVQEDGK